MEWSSIWEIGEWVVGGMAVAMGVYYLWFWYHYFTHRPLTANGKPMPGPSPRFITGLDFEFSPHHLHKRMEEYIKRYGPRFEMSVLHRPSFCTSDAEDVSLILSTKSLDMRMYPPMFDRYLKNKGILFTNNLEHWKIQRTAALHGMMSNSHLNQVARWAEQITDRLIIHWHSLFDDDDHSRDHGLLLDIDDHLTRVALDVIGKAAFNIDIRSVEGEHSEIGERIRAVMYATSAYFYVPPTLFNLYTPPALRQAEEALEHLRSFVRKTMLHRRNDNQRQVINNDLLEILLNYRGEDGNPLPDEDIIFTCWDMFIAGHETTAHTMAWALMLVAQHPDVQHKLQVEVDGIAALDDDRIEHLLPKLTYCQNVINETLRLYPTVPVFTRLSSQAQLIPPYHLKPWTPIFIYTPELHTNVKYWGKNGKEFVPERWEEKEGLPLHCYKPFGSGARSCVGNRMALIEAKIVLFKIIRHFEVEFTSKEEIDGHLNVTFSPQNLKLVLRPRNH